MWLSWDTCPNPNNHSSDIAVRSWCFFSECIKCVSTLQAQLRWFRYELDTRQAWSSLMGMLQRTALRVFLAFKTTNNINLPNFIKFPKFSPTLNIHLLQKITSPVRPTLSPSRPLLAPWAPGKTKTKTSGQRFLVAINMQIPYPLGN